MAKTCEELLIFRIENGTRSIKLGNKTPDQVDLTDQFKRLKALNPMMCEDLQAKHDAQVSAYNTKNKRK